MQTGPGTELALITLVAFVSLVQKQLELWQFGRLSTGLPSLHNRRFITLQNWKTIKAVISLKVRACWCVSVTYSFELICCPLTDGMARSMAGGAGRVSCA